MLEHFSQQAIKIIEDAKTIAKNMNSSIVGSEHLLLSLYLTKDSICRFLLDEQEITYEDLLDTLNKITIIHKTKNKDDTFSIKFEEIIIKSEQLINKLNNDTVYDEHIFYTLITDKDNIAYEILLLLGLDINAFILDIEDIFNFNESNKKIKYNYLINLTNKENLHPYIERDNYITRINYILNKKQKNNPLLIGSAGVGKTAIVEGLAKIKTDVNIYQLDLGHTISGTKYRGELEEKLLKAIEHVKKINGILFIDEIHNVVGAGSNDGSLDIANILKPYLSRGDISIIGATTLDEYYKFFEKDKALMRRFQPIFISEPTKEETKIILEGIKVHYEKYHNIKINSAFIDKIINLSDIYLPQRSYPDKAIDILDEVGARTKTLKKKEYNLNNLLNDVIKDLTNIYVQSVENIKKLNLYYDILKPYYIRFISKLNKHPNIFKSLVSENFNIEYLLKDLYKVFHFKKEMYLEIDLSFYNDSTSISNLLGSAKGYVGYDQGGILSEHILKYPMSLIYFKNYKQSNKQIINMLEKIMSNDFIVDNKGRKINLQNTMFLYDSYENNKQVGFIAYKNCDNSKNQLYLQSIQKRENIKKYIKILKKHNINICYNINTNIDNLEKYTYKLLLEKSGTYKIDNTGYKLIKTKINQ